MEIGGASILSINGEYTVWQNEKYQVNLRAGFGYIPESHFDFYSVSLGGNLVYKLKNRHHLETGAVVSYMHGFPASNSLLGDERLVLVGEGNTSRRRWATDTTSGNQDSFLGFLIHRCSYCTT